MSPVTASALFAESFWDDPYPSYAQLRTDDPVTAVDGPDGRIWYLTRYADVRAAFADPRLSKDWRYTLPPAERAGQHAAPVPMMLLLDPPAHTRLRRLVTRSFTVRRMEGLRGDVTGIAEELLAPLPADEPVDLMRAWAFDLPVFVICRLLGVPAADRDRFAGWSNTMVDNNGREAATAAMTELHGYLSELIERRRREPDDALISALITVADEDGDRLTEAELVAMAMILLIAGHETTVNLIGNGTLALLTHPEQRTRLAADPSLLPAAVEEILRWDSPVQGAPVRFAAEDVEYSGITIPAGAQVMLGLGAANRDTGADADRFRLDRDAAGHVAFGHGIHHCLGAQLARVEGQVALGTLLSHRPEVRLAADPAGLTYRHSTLVRGLTTLPVHLGPPART